MKLAGDHAPEGGVGQQAGDHHEGGCRAAYFGEGQQRSGQDFLGADTPRVGEHSFASRQERINGQLWLPCSGCQRIQANRAGVGGIQHHDVIHTLGRDPLQQLGDEVAFGVNDHHTAAGRDVGQCQMLQRRRFTSPSRAEQNRVEQCIPRRNPQCDRSAGCAGASKYPPRQSLARAGQPVRWRDLPRRYWRQAGQVSLADRPAGEGGDLGAAQLQSVVPRPPYLVEFGGILRPQPQPHASRLNGAQRPKQPLDQRPGLLGCGCFGTEPHTHQRAVLPAAFAYPGEFITTGSSGSVVEQAPPRLPRLEGRTPRQHRCYPPADEQLQHQLLAGSESR